MPRRAWARRGLRAAGCPSFGRATSTRAACATRRSRSPAGRPGRPLARELRPPPGRRDACTGRDGGRAVRCLRPGAERRLVTDGRDIRLERRRPLTSSTAPPSSTSHGCTARAGDARARRRGHTTPPVSAVARFWERELSRGAVLEVPERRVVGRRAKPARPAARAHVALQRRQSLRGALVRRGARRRAGDGGVRPRRRLRGDPPLRAAAAAGAVLELARRRRARRRRRPLPAHRRPDVSRPQDARVGGSAAPPGGPAPEPHSRAARPRGVLVRHPSPGDRAPRAGGRLAGPGCDRRRVVETGSSPPRRPRRRGGRSTRACPALGGAVGSASAR